jgi:predicted O-methyltransferase YrrM
VKPASIDSDWSLGQESLDVIVDLFRVAVPRMIVEFGSGASSVGLAKAFPGAQVLSVEHDPAWAWRTKALARSAGVENLCISLRPLKWQLHHFSLYQSYAPGALPATIDAALIDGPPYWAHVGREACFYQIARRLRRGSVLVLDDYSRGAEQNAVANWMLKYPRCLAAKSERVGHHLCVVDVTAPPVPVLNPLSLVRSWRALAARVRLEMWRTSKKRGW